MSECVSSLNKRVALAFFPTSPYNSYNRFSFSSRIYSMNRPHLFSPLSFLLVSLLMCAQHTLTAQVFCTAANRSLCESHLQALAEQPDLATLPMGEIATVVGKRFMGTPYVAKTLEIEGEEQLVVELQGLDCTTFLENVVVMSRLVKQQRLTFEDFQAELSLLRYRQGKVDGYPSRLHYFTDWLWDNEQKGITQNITAEIGGVPYPNTLDFMSTHPKAYAQLADGTLVPDIRSIEQSINARKAHYIPKGKVAAVERQIQSGDLIAITTDIAGLDISHVGLALQYEGRLHLFHASTGKNKVVISEKPLADYLAGNRRQTGIMVARLK